MAKKKKTEQKAENHKYNTEQIENKDTSLNQDSDISVDTETNIIDNNPDIDLEKNNIGEQEPDKDKADLKQIEAKLAEMQDKYIRLSAEFDNYRKRTLREKMDLSKYGAENILLKIIPFMDDFDRAMLHMDSATDCAAMKNGIDLIYGKFSEFLKQNGIKEIESLNSSFDVDLHEAVAKIEVKEKDKKGKVVDVIQKGYYLQDKVLRFAKVVVGE